MNIVHCADLVSWTLHNVQLHIYVKRQQTRRCIISLSIYAHTLLEIQSKPPPPKLGRAKKKANPLVTIGCIVSMRCEVRPVHVDPAPHPRVAPVRRSCSCCSGGGHIAPEWWCTVHHQRALHQQPAPPVSDCPPLHQCARCRHPGTTITPHLSSAYIARSFLQLSPSLLGLDFE